MEGTDLTLNKSSVISNSVSNGGKRSYNQVSSAVLGNMFPNVSQTNRTLGVTIYRKFFFNNKNASNETAVNSRIWISSRSTGGDYFRIKAGTDFDTQAEADDYTSFLGSGYLTSPAVTDSTSISAIFDTADGVYNGSLLRITDNSGGEEFLTVKSSGGVSWFGNIATITLESGIRSTYPSGQNSLVSGVVDLGDIVASASSWVETSVSGTYDESNYPVEVNNIGTVSDSWTLTFTSASAFSVSGSNTGSIGSGSISSNFTPINVSAGGGAYYMIIRSSGWGGTWTAGDTVTFSTVHSAAAVWIKEIVPAGTAAKTSNTVKFKLYAEGN